jgi:hypothetical protein
MKRVIFTLLNYADGDLFQYAHLYYTHVLKLAYTLHIPKNYRAGTGYHRPG